MQVAIATTGSAWNYENDPNLFCHDVNAYDNFAHFQVVRPYDDRWPEYGPTSSSHGVRVQWGAADITFSDNMFITYVQGGGKTRGLWLTVANNISTDIAFTNNLIRTVYQDDLNT